MPLRKRAYRYSVSNRHTTEEVISIRSMAPITLTVYYPKTEAGRAELARRVADVHAAAVIRQIKSLNCPTKQKLELLSAIIDTVAKRACEPA